MATTAQLNARRQELLSLSGSSASTSSNFSDVLQSRRTLIKNAPKPTPAPVKKVSSTPIKVAKPDTSLVGQVKDTTLRLSKEPIIGQTLKVAKDVINEGKKILETPQAKSAIEVYKNIVGTAAKVAAKQSGATDLKDMVEREGPRIGKILKKTPNLDLGTKGQKLFKATDAETKAINFISNFPSGIAQSLGNDIESIYTPQGREKLKTDAKNLPKTMQNVKTLVEQKKWQEAYEEAMSNSALVVGLDVAGAIPINLFPEIKGFIKGRMTARKIVEEAVQETTEQVVKSKITKRVVKKTPKIESYIEKPKNTQEVANIKYVTENPKKIVKDYEARVTKEYGTPHVITADESKYILPDYEGKRAPDYHESASGIAKYMYDKKLIERKGQGNNTVLFTAGGTGSGKTTALRKSGVDFKEYSIIYDTNLTGESAAGKIQKALDNGYKVEIKYVQRDPVKAFEEGVLPRVRTRDRIVTIDEHIARHKALDNVIDIKEKFGDKVNVQFTDNTRGADNSIDVSLDNLPKFTYNDNELRKILNEKLTKAINEGKITKEEGLAIRGTKGSEILPSSQQKSQTEVKPKTVSVPREQLPVKSKGTEKSSRLEARVTQSLDKTPQEIKDQLGSTYKQMSKPEQIKKATQYVTENPEEAMAVLRGDREAPKGLLKNSIYVAMENSAIGDVDLARKLASLSSTRAGQELSILTEINPDSPVKAIREVIKVREEALTKRGKDVVKSIKEESAKIKARVKTADKYDWNNFIKSIQC